MSNISELLTSEIYPAIFEKADEAFPEHEFKKAPDGWRSKTYLDGSEHSSRPDKTVIRKKAIGYITEWGSDSLSIWDYVQKRDGLNAQETLLKLAEMAGVPLPSNLTPEQMEAIAKGNLESKVWEDANTFFIDCLSAKGNKFAETARAYALRKYLIEERKFTPLDIRVPESKQSTLMEVGFIPGQQPLYRYLIEEKKHKSDDVYRVIKVNKEVGDSHVLTIPYRDPVGKIRGFAFRTIGTGTPKYIYSTGLKRDDILFNLTSKKEDKDVVMVEGLLDAGIATARGIKNVVALGGTSISLNQARQAIKYGAKKITLAFDNDAAGKAATLKAIEILRELDIPVYVVTYPDQVKDPDQLIREQGVEAFQNIIDNADRHYSYALSLTLLKYLTGQEVISNKQVDEIAEYVSIEASHLKPIDRDIYLDDFLRTVEVIPGLGGINKETLIAKAKELQFDQDKENQTKELTDLMRKAEAVVKKGETLEAIDLIETHIHTIKSADSVSQFRDLFELPQGENAVRERLSKSPDAVDTGFSIWIESECEPIRIPAGVLSFVAAPTNHGKTAFLINVGLNIVKNEKYKDRNVYLLTFEESAEKIIGYCLNAFVNEHLHQGVNYRKTILQYLKTGSMQFMSEKVKPDFTRKKNAFFKEYLETGRFQVRYIDYDSDKLISYINYIQSRDPNAVILLDYIQKMRRTAKGSIPNRQTELKLICEDLETCVNKTGLPMLLGAQFNREVISPQDMHPTRMAEASDIEKTASEIWGLWNLSKTILSNDKSASKIKEAAHLYRLDESGLDRNSIILQVLKSRSLPSGGYVKLPTEWKTGRIEAPSVSIYKPAAVGFDDLL